MACKWQFGSRRRDYLYAGCSTAAHLAGRGNKPICPHCDQPVLESQPWDECHVGTPRWLGGKSKAVGHRVCNHIDNNKVVTPQRAKILRVRAKHLGFKGPGLGKHPMPCGRASAKSKSMAGRVVDRVSLGEAHKAFVAKRYPFLQGERP